MKDTPTFYSSEVAKLMERSVRQVIDICEKGIVTPSVSDTTGSGHKREFSVGDLLIFALYFELKEIGFQPWKIKQIVAAMKRRNFFDLWVEDFVPHVKGSLDKAMLAIRRSGKKGKTVFRGASLIVGETYDGQVTARGFPAPPILCDHMFRVIQQNDSTFFETSKQIMVLSIGHLKDDLMKKIG
jgi:hypothetical protein